MHAFDLIPWCTGLNWKRLIAARCWNANVPDVPYFQDSAQLMAELSNGAGLLGDFSYSLPEKVGPGSEHYWRTTLFGEKGLAETFFRADGVKLLFSGTAAPEFWALEPPQPPGESFRMFMADVAGTPGKLDTSWVLETARLALTVQQCADEGHTGIPLMG